MRNPAFTLSNAQVITANYFRGQILSRSLGEWVTVTGVKRDGSERTYVGTLDRLVGKDSHEAVVIETRDGLKSMNLYNIKSLRPAQVL